MMNLIENELKKEEKYSLTENGAIGYKSSGSALVDLNFKVSSLRNKSEDDIIALFDKAFHENKEYALRWLFFARDIREGLGERRLFRICFKRLIDLDVDLFYKNLDIIQEYGRWDDLVSLIGVSDVTDEVIGYLIEMQLGEDMGNIKNGKSISLIGKWLPSENASSKDTKELAKKVRKLLGLSPRMYRLTLSKLRNYLDVVEVKMCNKKWDEIDYNKVPSMANLKYKDAFLRNDGARRLEYLDSVKKGKSKMNMSVANPVDVVRNYYGRYNDLKDYDEALELAWDNVKDVMVGDTLVVADGSGSMYTNVGGGVEAIHVANALAIYTSEHNSGIYKNKYITFSNKPQFVEFGEDDSLKKKLEIAEEHDEMTNTNIEKVFDLILGVALTNDLSDDEMVDNILIISDMEFDNAQRSWADRNSYLTKSLFDDIKKRYEVAGYKLPKLIFWNVNSRTGTIPLIENELGVALVSGFSQNVLKMVMSNKYDPYEILLEMINVPRYDLVRV